MQTLMKIIRIDSDGDFWGSVSPVPAGMHSYECVDRVLCKRYFVGAPLPHVDDLVPVEYDRTMARFRPILPTLHGKIVLSGMAKDVGAYLTDKVNGNTLVSVTLES